MLLVLAAILTALPAAADTAIRAGTYDLEIDYGGMQVAGVLTLTTADKGFTATLEAGPHAPPVKAVVRKGAHLTMTVGAPDGDVIYQLDFEGDRLVGTFEMAGVPGKVKGTRRR